LAANHFSLSMTAALAIVATLLALAALQLWKLRMARLREHHIRTFAFPRGVFAKVIAKYPHLSQKDMALVSHGLRQFFLAYLRGGKQHVAMPSQVADELWHEFILCTRHYQDFTRQAFGGFLHHTPSVVLSSMSRSNAGLRRCWRHVCLEENINPRKPSRLPLLFALDKKLLIANGFHYVAECSGVSREGESGSTTVYCGGDFANSSIDGGTDGLSDAGTSHHHGTSHDGDGGVDGGSGGDGGGDGCGGSGGCGGD
jgi:hypothetical protein